MTEEDFFFSENYLNITNDELDRSIYRILSFDRLITMLETEKNVLVKPEKWDDPFENFILKRANFLLQGQQNFKYDLHAHDSFYGQCWTTQDESDAMWRIYSPQKDGVKIKTTIRKLYKSLEAMEPVLKGISYIGKVEYFETKRLRDLLENESYIIWDAVEQRPQAQTLLLKRLEFEHEKEIRLLFKTYNDFEQTIIPYYFDPKNVIEDLQFDPQISDNNYKIFYSYLVDKLKFDKPISISSLYKIPDLYTN